MHSSQSNPISRSPLLLCISLLLPILHAFSTSKLLNSRHSQRPISLAIHAQQGSNQVYHDDECYDLCGAWDVPIEVPKEQPVKQSVKRTNTVYKTRHRLRPSPWSSPQPDVCSTCGGTGELICRFCEETGFLSQIGSGTDVVFYAGLGHDCPVCKDGLERCCECVGTGYVYSWEVERKE